MLKIYGYAASINVRKVLWACEELDLEFEREDGGGALNPVGMVPVIDDAGIVIWESIVIVRYLATRQGRTDLLPADAPQRAHVEQWMDWQASDFNNSWRVAFQGFTVADIPIGLAIHRWYSTPIQRPAYVNVDRYYERLLQRSGFRLYGRDRGP